MSDSGDLAIENVLRPNYDKIYQLLINPLDVSRQLYAEGVLGENVLDELSTESKSLSSQKDCFFKHLRGVIRGGGHGKLKSFARVLLKYKNTVDVAERLLKEYGKLSISYYIEYVCTLSFDNNGAAKRATTLSK